MRYIIRIINTTALRILTGYLSLALLVSQKSLLVIIALERLS
jgi:hypothetical protein